MKGFQSHAAPPSPSPGGGKVSLVSAVACPDYDLDRVREALRAVLEPLGGMGRFIRPGQRVLIKPNLLSARPPEDAVTTHPALVQAVAEAVLQAGGEPLIGDAPGAVNTRARLEKVYTTSGMAQVAQSLGLPLNYDMGTVEWTFPEGRWLRRVPVWRAAAEAEVLINLPKLKTHNLVGLTGAVKNCFGLIPSPHKTYLHMRWPRPDQFSEMLLDLYLRARPALHILDAVVAMEGDGPSAGDPRPVGALLASTDGLACDVAMAALVGHPPHRVTTTAAAIRRGLTEGRVEALRWAGTPLADLRVQKFRPSVVWLTNSPVALWVLGQAGRFTAARPEMTEACIGCGLCADNCPAKAIAISNGRAQVDLGKCIHCFCCHELCPQQAVEVHRPRLGDWIVRLFSR
jgi:uncharacterized protein (DUF362 family)/Pyruvate/2-oxoacid:ferredoxin oxidoreductase delta subunit